MKKSFVCDDSIVITIPIGGLTDAREGQLMPKTFQCVYKDFYKVFVINGKPKPLGVAQAIAGVFILMLSVIFVQTKNAYTEEIGYCTLPSALLVVSGMLSYATGRSPNMNLTKLSFILNIISFLWSTMAVFICAKSFHNLRPLLNSGIAGLIIALLLVEKLIALFLIYWSSKAVCRQHFNSLPIVLLKQGED